MPNKNSNMQNQTVYKSIKEKILSKAMFWAILSIVILIFIEGNKVFISNLHATFGVLLYDCLRTLGQTSLGIFLIKIYWDLSAKTDFAEQIISMCNISNNIDKSGVVAIQHSFMKIDWEKFFKNSKEIDLALYHGFQTINTCGEFIKEILSTSNPPPIRVKFPNHKNIGLMKQIANLEQNNSPESVAIDIKQSIEAFKRMIESYPAASITIFISDYMFPFSIYKSNQKSIVLLSKNALDDRPVIIECNNEGTFATYITNHFQDICSHSKPYSEL